MPDFIGRAIESIRTMLGGLNTGQRVGLVVLAGLLVASLIWGVTTAMSGNGWVPITAPDASQESRAQIRAVLEQKGFELQVRADGVYVRPEEGPKVAMELAQAGVPMSDVRIWSWLDEADITGTRWQREKRFQISLQRKIEQMLRMMKPIKEVQVQITPASEQRTLGMGGPEPTAAAIFSLKPGEKFTEENVMAMANVVAASVQGMKVEKVSITDNRGHLYPVRSADDGFSAARTRSEAEEAEATQLEEKIRTHLQDMFKRPISVAAHVSLATESITKNEERREEENRAPIEESKYSRIDKSDTQAFTGGFKGNEPVVSTPVGAGKMDLIEKEDKTRSVAGFLKTDTVIPPGTPKDRSVSVLYPMYAEETEESLAQTLITPKVLSDAVQKAGGLKPEQVNVAFVKVPQPGEAPYVPTTWDRFSDFLERHGGLVGSLVITLIVAFVVLRIVRGMMAKDEVAEVEQLRTLLEEKPVEVSAEKSAAAEAGAVMPAGQETAWVPGAEALRGGVPAAQVVTTEAGAPGAPEVEDEMGRMRTGIRDLVGKHPRTVATFVKRWLVGK